jgi:hypothetical protein
VRREKYAASEVERCSKATGFHAAGPPKEALELITAEYSEPPLTSHESRLTSHV